jgi:hypothetical protein
MATSMARDKALVLAFMATWPIAGFLEPWTPSFGQPITEVWLPHALALAIITFAWCRAHAKAMGRVPPAYAAPIAAVAWPIGVPLYLLRLLPWRAALLALSKALGVFVVCALLYAGGLYAGMQLAA